MPETYDIEIRRNLQFGVHDDEVLTGDYYAPSGPGPFPALIALHGGFWKRGSAEGYQYWGPYLAQRGYALFSVNYRLVEGTKNRYPAAVHDTRAAVQFLRSKAAALKVDPDRIGFIGDSAEAHLAALVALAGDTPFAAVLAGCASPAARGTRDAISSASSPAEPSAAAGPRFAQGGPDAEDYGASAGYPIGDRETCSRPAFLVGCHSHFDQVYEGRLVRRAAAPSPLARAASEPVVRYEYQGQTFTLDDYLARNPATGLLVARGDTILIERYQYARHDRHRFMSWSMAKTVTAMLIGIAIAEGRIRSADDPVAAYVPVLADTEYGRTSLRHLLQMSSGVRFIEEYTGKDDASRLADNTFRQAGSGGVEAVTPFNVRVAPSGTRFYYASVETQVLGLVLRNAVGRPVADYMQEKIWEPMGAEADATWLIDRASQEAAYCCINAVLRDYARLGLLLAHDGRWRGQQIIPAAWIKEATGLCGECSFTETRYNYQERILP